MDIIVYNEENGQFKYSGNRPAFDFKEPDVEFQDGSKRNSNGNKDKDICHSISFHTIAIALANALNLFKYKINDDDDDDDDADALEYLVHYIAGIIVSVKTERVYIGNGESCYAWISTMCDNEENYAEQYKKYLNLIHDIVNAADYLDEKDDFLYRCVWHYIAIKASEIARLLNSEPSNLRYGFGKWNRSIKDAYDPIFVNPVGKGIEITHPYDNIRITNLLNYTIGKISKITEKGVEKIIEIPGNIDALNFYTCKIYEDPDKEILVYEGIYSSSLSNDLWRSVGEVNPYPNPIYYYDYLTQDPNNPDQWMRTQIPTYINGTT